jgi:Zn-finger nucleic acid-binding protein
MTVQRLADAARRLRCPRCQAAMTEYQHQLVRADKCDECFGIFFDNGELELVIAKTLEDRDAQWSTWGDLFHRTS